MNCRCDNNTFFCIAEVGDVVSISRPTRESAAISFRPSVRQQLIYSPSGIMGRLFVVYDVKRDLDVGDISVSSNRIQDCGDRLICLPQFQRISGRPFSLK